LIILGVLDSLAFGVGVAFLVYGYPVVRRLAQGRLAWATYLSIAWSLVSWWPHSNMHRANTTLEGLVLIDWTFHLTLIVGAAVIGTYLYTVMSKQRTESVGSRSHATAAQVRP
jgi:hypothetical protein